jgi:N-acetyl-anhydromuramyl-L-alanine amidase AmpD
MRQTAAQLGVYPTIKNLTKTALALVLLTSCAKAQPTYTNSDIENLKIRYEPKHRSTSTSLSKSALFSKPYQEPKYVSWFLPYQTWEAEYRNYFQRHYHDPSLTLKPTLICMHYTVTPSASTVYDMFCRGTQMCAGDAGTVFGHVSVHLMIDKDGTIYQLLPFDRKCTGAYGVNHKAISIEMVATTESDLLSHPAQLYQSFCVVRDLMRKYNIPLSGLIAHSDVSAGKSVVPEYLDYADSKYPDSYPSSSTRTDPGSTYMTWLRDYIEKNGPAPAKSQNNSQADPEKEIFLGQTKGVWKAVP